MLCIQGLYPNPCCRCQQQQQLCPTLAMPSPTALSYLTSCSTSRFTEGMERHVAGARDASPCTRAYEEGCPVAEA